MSEETHTSNQTYSKDEWQDFCREWETSGEPQEKFCLRKGIPYNTFVYWRGKFTKKSKQRKGKKFAPVKIKENRVAPSLALKITLPNGVSITHIEGKQALSMVFSLLGIKGC